MKHQITVFCIVFAIALAANAGPNELAKTPPLRLLLSETQPGTMATEHYCMLVFADRSFHAEKANRKMGKDRIRKVYEGQLSEADWNALGAIIDSKEFRELRVPASPAPLVVENSHPYAISVARGKGFQNLEFLTDKSRKPYESQLKPLLQWWKSVRSVRMPESEAPPDSRCALDSSKGIFSN